MPEQYDENVEWDLTAFPLVDLPDRGSGRDNLFRVWADYAAGWREYRAEVVELIDTGDDVIVVMHETAQVGETEVVVEREIPHVFTVREGRIVKWRVFRTTAEARSAVGLSEHLSSPSHRPRLRSRS